MRKSLWFTSTGGAVRISIIALACLFLSATGARADSFTYTYTGADFAIAVAPYTTSDSVDGTLVLSAALPANSSLVTQSTALVLSYSFTDGVQTLTNLNSTIQNFQFSTDASGAIGAWSFSVVDGTQKIVTFNEFPFQPFSGEFGGSTVSGEPNGSTFGSGTWSGPVVGSTAVPEPGTLGMMFSGLVGLGLLVGVKRYRGNRLENIA